MLNTTNPSDLKAWMEKYPMGFYCSLVTEFRDKEGCTTCAPMNTADDLIEAMNDPEFTRSFWTVYGQTSKGLSIALADCPDQLTADAIVSALHYIKPNI